MEILENKIKTLEEVFEKKVKGLKTYLKEEREKKKASKKKKQKTKI